MGYAMPSGNISNDQKKIPSDKLKRKRIIKSIVLAHNYHTHFFGLNEIKTVFDPEYERIMNITGFDCISRYYYNN